MAADTLGHPVTTNTPVIWLAMIDIPTMVIKSTPMKFITTAPRLLPVEYTVENGQLIFTVNQLGLFLLIAE